MGLSGKWVFRIEVNKLEPQQLTSLFLPILDALSEAKLDVQNFVNTTENKIISIQISACYTETHTHVKDVIWYADTSHPKEW